MSTTSEESVHALPTKLRVVNHGIGQIDLRHLKAIKGIGYGLATGKIIELHMKEDGSIDDRPSLAFVSVIPKVGFIINEVSLASLHCALKELGYGIKKM